MKHLITCITAILMLGAAVAHGALYEFRFAALVEEGDNITNEFSHAVGQEQFRMVVDIANPSNGLATFSFYNLGPTESVLTSARLDEGTGIGLVLDNIVNDFVPGYTAGDADTVDFLEMANPNVPPANGIDPPFVFDADIGVRANGAIDLYTAAVQNNAAGYAGAEKVTLEMSYDVNSDLLAMLTGGELRVVTKLQGVQYPGGPTAPEDQLSEYFVNETGYVIIPEPASLVLLVGASSLIAFIRRRFIG